MHQRTRFVYNEGLFVSSEAFHLQDGIAWLRYERGAIGGSEA